MICWKYCVVGFLLCVMRAHSNVVGSTTCRSNDRIAMQLKGKSSHSVRIFGVDHRTYSTYASNSFHTTQYARKVAKGFLCIAGEDPSRPVQKPVQRREEAMGEESFERQEALSE